GALHPDRFRVADEGGDVDEDGGVLGVAEQEPRAGQRRVGGDPPVDRVELPVPGVDRVGIADQLGVEWVEPGDDGLVGGGHGAFLAEVAGPAGVSAGPIGMRGCSTSWAASAVTGSGAPTSWTTASTTLLVILATSPMPGPPTWKTLPAMASSTSRQVSRVAASPPTMMARVPASAPLAPPLMGASRKPMPRSAARAASCRQVDGWIVEWTTTVDPAARVSSTPGSSTPISVVL